MKDLISCVHVNYSYVCFQIKNVCDVIIFQTIKLFLLDIDECESGTAGCDEHAMCANTEGSFVCTCDSGFEGSGSECTGEWILC